MGEREFSRTDRVAEHVQRELAAIIARDMEDPRVTLVTVSAVRVSKDLGHARVYVTLPEGRDRTAALRALNHAAGYLRHRLGERLRMRQLPQLRFVHDDRLEEAMRVDELIEHALGRGTAAASDGEDR